MNRSGHIGFSLLIYAPIFGVLIIADYTHLGFLGLGIAFISSMLPDKDQKLPLLKHRGASHSLLSALVIGIIVGITVYAFTATSFAIVGIIYAVAVIINMKLRIVRHKGSHTVLALLIAVLSLGGFTFVPNGYTIWHLVAFSGAISSLSVLSHITADLLTPAGVKPFWPVTDKKYSLNLFRFDNSVANIGSLFFGLFSIFLSYYLGTFVI